MATRRLAECYSFEVLAKMARPLIRRYGLQAEVGADDVANTVLYAICTASGEGRTPELEPGEDSRKFARLLLVREVSHVRSRVCRMKRGGSGRHKAPACGDGGPWSGPRLQRVALDLDGLQAIGPAVEDLVIASMEEERLSELLDDPELEHIATMRLQRYTVPEIAREIRQCHASVSRKILQIQTIWRESGLES